MRIAYLTNQYPSVSHTFIRREIEALEALGVTVERFSARQMPLRELPDARDREEGHRTTALLAGGAAGLLQAGARVMARSPYRFARASALALQLGQRSDRGAVSNQAYLFEACVLLEQLQQRGVEHVHAHFGTNAAAIAMLAHALGGPTFSFTVHGPEEFDKPDLLALREKIAHAAFVVGVSSFGRSQLYRYCAMQSWSKVHVVRCGLGSDYLDAPTSSVPDVPHLLNVGRLSEQKGQLLLVQAAARLHARGLRFKLTMIGDGPLRAYLQEHIDAAGLQDTVRITGWLSGQGVRAEVEASRAVVMSSFAEGLPVALMEALAAARPAISTQIAGVPELVRNGENGLLVAAGSVSEMASAMEQLLTTSAAELTEMGQRGRARVLALHDARKSAAQLIELFQSYGRA